MGNLEFRFSHRGASGGSQQDMHGRHGGKYPFMMMRSGTNADDRKVLCDEVDVTSSEVTRACPFQAWVMQGTTNDRKP